MFADKKSGDLATASPLLSLSFSTLAPALVTKAMSKVPLNPRAPWDTHHQPSRAPSTPTRPTVTEDPCHSLTSRGVKLLLVFSQPSTTSAPRLPCPGWTLVPSLHHSNSSHPSFQTALTFDLSPNSLQRHCNTKADEHRNQTKSNEKTNSASSAR